MKIFEFHPQTGRIGALMGHKRVASWADASLSFLESEGVVVPDHTLPIRKDAEFCAHSDAGCERYSEDTGIEFVSYRHATKWIAFCIGRMRTGTEGEFYWDWWILPPVAS